MSYEAGSVIGGVERGESNTDSAIKSDSGNQSGRERGPEIIGGYESEEPRTERITGDSGSTTGGPKLTKSGRIDGRTLRGKRTSETAAQKPGAVTLDKLDLTEVIFSMHMMLAGIVAVPELELDRGESEKLGDAIKNVGQYYGAVFDPKKVAVFHLAMVAGGIYGTRIFAIKNRLGRQKQEKPKIVNASPMRGTPQPAGQVVNGAPMADGKPTEKGIPFEVLGFGNGDAAL
jgi:hypothetical protein